MNLARTLESTANTTGQLRRSIQQLKKDFDKSHITVVIVSTGILSEVDLRYLVSFAICLYTNCNAAAFVVHSHIVRGCGVLAEGQMPFRVGDSLCKWAFACMGTRLVTLFST